MTETLSHRIVSGIPRGAVPWWLLHEPPHPKWVILSNDEEDVLPFTDDLNGLADLPLSGLALSRLKAMGYPAQDEVARQVALHEWLFGKTQVLVASLEGVELPCDLPQDLRNRSFLIRPGLTIQRHKFEDVLAKGGYGRTERCEQTGDYAIRGDVIDIWPASETIPVRIGWTFDTVDSLRKIDLNTQRSDEFLREIFLHPVKAGAGATLWDMIPNEAGIVVYNATLPEGRETFGPQTTVIGADGASDPVLPYEGPPLFTGHMDLLRKQLEAWTAEDWRVLIVCHNQGERDRLEELILDPVTTQQFEKPDWAPQFFISDVEHGFVDRGQRVAILTNSEIFGRYRKRLRLPKFDGGEALKSPLDLSVGDFLVHEKHGVGRYLGLKTLKVGRITSEYLQIEYKGGDKIYVPIFEIQQVQKYLGAEGKRPALSSLDTPAWERMKGKVKEEVAKLAAELLKNAAKRSLRPGYAFPAPTHLEQEFAAGFMYKLTSDQEKTIDEVFTDMTSSKAMDRLVCGDVGYGKTEVAMRAALKAALAAKQVCLLCPTTILAEQHFRNFSERLADYPVTIQLISRFQEKSDQKKTLELLAKGGVDIIIGTHRLLSDDVAFKDLGLLIIDEEHRFGVKQKTKLFKLRDTVDVLALTATPIPRTLASSLGGIKDLSVIETPPEGRLPISTHVGVFDEDVMVDAVQKELARGGQVFYVHNRVKTLLSRKEWLESVLPGVRIVMAHGQHSAHELEKAMVDFLHRKVDILLATTIIESGLDIPSVNTLIVEEAEEMGLAQLYQLRGRVGRSAKKAFCYLFYSQERITGDARKRLQALKDYTALGSGFRLAMRDMEIRGAGNLLGPQQHGNMAAVGIETYSKLLNEEIQRIKGEPVQPEDEGPLLEMSLSAYIPDEYLPSESERVQMYKRVLSANLKVIHTIREELEDRCGPAPEPVKLLFDAAVIRLELRKHGIAEVHQDEDHVQIFFKGDFKIPEKSFNILLAQSDDVLTFISGARTGLRFFLKETEPVLDGLSRFLRLLFTN